MSNVYMVLSGKGGVGNSTITANLGVLLARAGHPVTLIDADIGLRSLDLFLNMENRVVYDLVDVAKCRCLLSQALLPAADYPNLKLLPASQFSRCRDLDPRKLEITVSGLTEGASFRIRQRFLNREHGSILDKWLRLGRSRQLSQDGIEYLS